MEPDVLELLKTAERVLQYQQSQEGTRTREKAIALTELQTAILWIEKDESSSD